MDTKHNKTTLAKGNGKRAWFILDATGKTLGRFASEVSKILRGKHRPDFTPNVDCGDGVIIINAEKIAVTGSKSRTKVYRHYTGSMSGLRETPYDVVLARHPSRIIERAVSGMMPKTRLARGQMKRLRIFKGDAHTHIAQKPIQAEI